MFNRGWHLIRRVTNPVMQIEPFVFVWYGEMGYEMKD